MIDEEMGLDPAMPKYIMIHPKTDTELQRV
jgi:hypothetical protein